MSPVLKMNSHSKSSPSSKPSQTKLPRIETTTTIHGPEQPPMTKETALYVHRLSHQLAYGIANGFIHRAHAATQAHLRARKKLELEQRKKGRSGEITWVPRMDQYDDPEDDRIVSTFEIPGVDGKDLSLDVQDGHFVMEGKRPLKLRPRNTRYSDWELPTYEEDSISSKMDVDHDEDEPREGTEGTRVRLTVPRCPIAELRFGKFKRSIPLPPGVGKDHVIATLSNGILQVSWPRHVDNPTSPVRDDSPVPRIQDGGSDNN